MSYNEERLPNNDTADKSAETDEHGDSFLADLREVVVAAGTFAAKHPAFFSASLITLAVMSRFWNVAGRNPLTVRALVGATPASDIVIGTIAPIIALAVGSMSYIVGAVLAFRIQYGFAHSRDRSRAIIALALTVVLTTLFLPTFDNPRLVTTIILGYAFAGAIILVGYGPRPMRFSLRDASYVRQLWTAAPLIFLSAVPLLFFIIEISSNVPWIPPERVILDDGSPLVVYVVNEDADDLVILHADTRLVERIPSQHVKDRMYCSVGSPQNDSYPPCSLDK